MSPVRRYKESLWDELGELGYDVGVDLIPENEEAF